MADAKQPAPVDRSQEETQTVETLTADWPTRPVTFNVTLRSSKADRYVPILDEEGQPVVTKKGETRKQMLKIALPIDLPTGDFDQWTDLFALMGRDPEQVFAELANYAQKQAQESEKGDTRQVVTENAEACGLHDPKVSNKALTEKILGRPKVVEAIAAFQSRVASNFIGAPKPATKKAENKATLENVKKIEAASPGLIARLSQMTPEQFDAFMAAAGPSDG